MIHTIIFDVGGTLVDAPDLFDVFASLIRIHHKIDLKEELIVEFHKHYVSANFKDIKTILTESVAKILKTHNIDSSDIDPSTIYHAHYINQSSLFSETKDTLNYLKSKKIHLIIVSDADADVLIPELKKLEIYDYFENILISSDLKCYKTSKQIVNYILPKISKPLEGILFVGDTTADILTAKELGVKSVFIKRTKKEIEADFKISSLLELKNLI
ncbi:MAG: HAD family hydrolase [Candidatus Nanoarchaeia archaeon]